MDPISYSMIFTSRDIVASLASIATATATAVAGTSTTISPGFGVGPGATFAKQVACVEAVFEIKKIKK